MTTSPASEDRRILRTRTALREALITSIFERGWERSSIQHICAQAKVGRSTFYTHFADKEELLQSGFKDLRRLLRAAAGGRASGRRSLGFSLGLFEHAYENRRLFRALLGKRSGHAIQKQFLGFVSEMVEDELALLLEPGIEREATIQYLAGAFTQLVIWWLESRKPLGPVEIDALFQRFTRPVIAAARTS